LVSFVMYSPAQTYDSYINWFVCPFVLRNSSCLMCGLKCLIYWYIRLPGVMAVATLGAVKYSLQYTKKMLHLNTTSMF
jgi:hypothetical protein